MIGPANYKSLFDLSLGSALAIVIDTSDSMSNEIEAVKEEVHEIVDAATSEGIVPSVYILSAYETDYDLTSTQAGAAT